MNKQIKLIHIIWQLEIGGAETSLFKQLSMCDRSIFAPEVISMKDIGVLGQRIKDLGINVKPMNSQHNLRTISAFFRLVCVLKKENPDIIHTWMLTSNLLGTITKCLIHIEAPIIWSVRNLKLNKTDNRVTDFWVNSLCARASRSRARPSAIVFNSKASWEWHTQIGYDTNICMVIPSGFDTATFKPDTEAALSVRRELNIPSDSVLIGLAARYVLLKGHRTFIEAAAKLLKLRPDVHFLLCGSGVSWDNAELAEMIRAQNIQNNCHLLGIRIDMPRIQAALTIGTSSSYNEALPRMIGEAMSCEVPCVVTNVGDSAYLVEKTGIIVPPHNSDALAQAWQQILNMDIKKRTALGVDARKRILKRFDLREEVNEYEKLYLSTMEQHRRRRLITR